MSDESKWNELQWHKDQFILLVQTAVLAWCHPTETAIGRDSAVGLVYEASLLDPEQIPFDRYNAAREFAAWARRGAKKPAWANEVDWLRYRDFGM